MKKSLGQVLILIIFISLLMGGIVMADSEFKVQQADKTGDALQVLWRDTMPSGAKREATAVYDNQKFIANSCVKFNSAQDGTAIVLLIDISKSLYPGQINDLSLLFNGLLDKLQSNDQVAVVTFGESIAVRQEFSKDKTLLRNAMSQLRLTDNYTNLYGGLVTAFELANSNDKNLPQRRVIMLVSDGQNDPSDNTSRQAVWEQLRDKRFAVYVVETASITPNSVAEQFLHELAVESGAVYFPYKAGGFTNLGGEIARVMMEDIYKVNFALNGKDLKATSKNTTIDAVIDGKSYSDNIHIAMTSTATGSASNNTSVEKGWRKYLPSKIPVWLIVAIIVCALIVITVLIKLAIKRVTNKHAAINYGLETLETSANKSANYANSSELQFLIPNEEKTMDVKLSNDAPTQYSSDVNVADITPIISSSEEQVTIAPAVHIVTELSEDIYGWLVLANGQQRGEALTLRKRSNSFGLDNNKKLLQVVTGSIEMEFADDGKNILRTAVADNSILINGQMMIDECVLQPYDRICIEELELIFVPMPAVKRCDG